MSGPAGVDGFSMDEANHQIPGEPLERHRVASPLPTYIGSAVLVVLIITVVSVLYLTNAHRLAGAVSPEDQVRALLGLKAVFPAQIAGDDRLIERLTYWLAVLTTGGASAALQTLAGRR